MGTQESSINNKIDFSAADHFFKTIGEVSAEIGIPPHVLRFWESKFLNIKPHKRKGGHRYYSEVDIRSIYEIKKLLYDQGYTIKGAQKHLKEKGFMQADVVSINQHNLFDSAAENPPLPQKTTQLPVSQPDLLETTAKTVDVIDTGMVKLLLDELRSIRKTLVHD